MDRLTEVITEFDKHVPFGDASLLALKAHLVIERRLVAFIRERASKAIVAEATKATEGSYRLKLILARALADRDEIPIENSDAIWKALEKLGKLPNDLAHNLELSETSVSDQMRTFIRVLDPEARVFPEKVEQASVHKTFWATAAYLNSTLEIHREPLWVANEMLDE